MNSSETDSTSEGESESLRRSVLRALGAVAGAAAVATPVAAQGDGEVETRGCSDAALRPSDWSTGVVTVQACPGSGGGIVEVEATGDVGPNRHRRPVGPQARSFAVADGERRSIWFTGQLLHFACSNADLNVGVVNRAA